MSHDRGGAQAWMMGFVGLAIPAGMIMVDTGAQEAVMGKIAFDQHVRLLEKVGLRPEPCRIAEDARCGGIGGGAKLVGVYDVPCGIGGVNGLL
eukprot:6194680-Alexandrium_andersonii.AAC.1